MVAVINGIASNETPNALEKKNVLY